MSARDQFPAAVGQVITGTNTVNGTFREIRVVTATQFHTLTGSLSGAANTTIGSAPTYPANHVLSGLFSSIKLHGGSVVAYQD
jgi:hypothetical protein